MDLPTDDLILSKQCIVNEGRDRAHRAAGNGPAVGAGAHLESHGKTGRLNEFFTNSEYNLYDMGPLKTNKKSGFYPCTKVKGASCTYFRN